MSVQSLTCEVTDQSLTTGGRHDRHHPLPVDDRPTNSVTPSAPVADNRPIYLAWGSAWAVGYGAMALDSGSTPVLDLPALVAPGLLALGLLAAPWSPAS